MINKYRIKMFRDFLKNENNVNGFLKFKVVFTIKKFVE